MYFLDTILSIPIYVISYLSECHYSGSLSRLLFFVWKHNILLGWLVFVVSYRRAPSQSKPNKASQCLARINLSSTEDAQKEFSFNHLKFRGDPVCNSTTFQPGSCVLRKPLSNCLSRSNMPTNEACQWCQPCPICSLAFWIKRWPRVESAWRWERRRRVFLAKAHPAELSIQMWAQWQSGLKSVCV